MGLIKNIKNKKITLILIALIFIGISAFLFYKKADQKPDIESQILIEAREYAKKEQIGYAMEKYNKIVRLFPENYDAHIELARLYAKTDEDDMAKVELTKATMLGYKTKYQAELELAYIYLRENNFSMALSYINEIKNVKKIKTPNIHKELGDFYHYWAKNYTQNDKAEKIRKLREAYNYYAAGRDSKGSKLQESLKTRNEIRKLYIEMANELSNMGKYDDAKEILKQSLVFWNNSTVLYQLANVYEKEGNIENAIDTYEKAFLLNPKAGKTKPLESLLLKKASEYEKNGDKVSAELYYTKAKKLNPKLNTQKAEERNFVLNVLSVKANEDFEKDIFKPEVVLKLNNISQKNIEYLKAKIIFLSNDKVFSEEYKVLADKTTVLKPGFSFQVNILASKPLNYVFDKHTIEAQIYVSEPENTTNQDNKNKWKLYRKVHIPVKKESDVIFVE